MVKGCLTALVGLGLVIVGIAFIGVVKTRHDGQLAPIVDGDDTVSNSISERRSTSPPPLQPALRVSALKLYMDYQANEVAADNLYKNRRLAVQGMVITIRKDFLDKAVLELATTNEFEQVGAYLAPSEEAKAASLQKYTVVTVICEGSGMVVGSPMLRDCRISEDETPKVNAAEQPSQQLAPPATPDENGIYRSGRGLTPPQVLDAPEPEFSDEPKQPR